MKTNLKVILTAIGIATLASPVMAQSLITRPDVGGPAAYTSNALGPVASAHRKHHEWVAPVVPFLQQGRN